jgi:deazaflavin-dependent oxidoreductase (nitroreductase family)
MANRILQRLESRVFRIAIERFGAKIDNSWILEVAGRRTGVPRYTPVKLLDVDSERFLVALYGDTEWSRNLRAARGRAKLRRRRRILPVLGAELPPDERPRILGAYLATATRPKTVEILGAGRRQPDEVHLQRIAAAHPVFRLSLTSDEDSWVPEESDGGSSRPVASARPDLWAVISGAAGLVSGVFLILFFVVARPFSGEPSPWAWFGPANDLTSALQAGALIPVAVALRDLIGGRDVQRWTRIGVAAMTAATVLPILLIAGLLPFAVQAPLVTFCIAVMFWWLFAISRAGLRTGALPRAVARAGIATSLGFAIGAVIVALALLMPSGSVAQYLAFAVGAVPGVLAWLGFPVWTLLLRSVLNRRIKDTPLTTPSAVNLA